MRYRELYDEYTAILHRYVEISQEQHTLPKGYVIKKKISGKEYHYLQFTVRGKKKSEYLRDNQVEAVKRGLERGKLLKAEKEANQREMVRLETAVKILDADLSRTFYFLRQCSEMDAMPVSKREKAMSFARAMTALEGLPAQPETEENLRLWGCGEKRFSEFYLPALRKYRIVGELQ